MWKGTHSPVKLQQLVSYSLFCVDQKGLIQLLSVTMSRWVWMNITLNCSSPLAKCARDMSLICYETHYEVISFGLLIFKDVCPHCHQFLLQADAPSYCKKKLCWIALPIYYSACVMYTDADWPFAIKIFVILSQYCVCVPCCSYVCVLCE